MYETDVHGLARTAMDPNEAAPCEIEDVTEQEVIVEPQSQDKPELTDVEEASTSPQKDKQVLDDFGKAFHSSGDDTPEAATGSSNLPQDVFHVKVIETLAGSFSIVLQSENGPCPLIAVFNTLQIQGKIAKITKPRIQAAELCSLFGNFLLDLAQQRSGNVEHTEHYIVDCLERFGKIQTGVDVNVKFNSVRGFEYTADLAMFDMAGVRLLHGWLIDPQDKVLTELVGDMTYNQIVEVAMSKCDSETVQEMNESLILQEHLATTQLTVYGLCELHQVLGQNESCVLFRNNHFNTLVKHNDMLYVLVSDVGWENDPNVVWETLENTDNNSTFVDGGFRKSGGSETPPAKPAVGLPEYEGDDEAYALALQLQHLDIPEQERVEQQRLWDDSKRAAQGGAGSSRPRDPPSRTASVKSEKSSCTLQ